MAIINNQTGEFESNSNSNEEQTPTLEFLSNIEIAKLVETLEDWAGLPLGEQILMVNEMARELSGEKVSPLAVKTRNGEVIYPHVTYLSKLSSFCPLLALPHSGQGFHTLSKIGIQHPAVLSYEVTIGELRLDGQQDEDEKLSKEELDDIFKAKVRMAKKILRLKHGSPKAAKAYKVGETLPEGEMVYHLDYGDGRYVAGPSLSKAGFKFIVGALPELNDTDFTLVGSPQGATRCKVQIKIPGQWVSTSEAEKFAAMLTKLCVEKMPKTEAPEDLLKGGILLYEDIDLPLSELALQILEEKLSPCPLTDVMSGQETQKGASTAEPASAFLRALTGKGVLREEVPHTQTVNGKEMELGHIVWDSNEFVTFREVWNESSIHKAVWVKWVDDWMHGILVQSTKKQKEDYYYVPCGHGGVFWFHRTEVRVELAPLSMETATQKECLSGPKGSMFSELIQTIGQL